ncbi:hypothetical protein NEOLEDRAFT_332192 [Neolentinus lepideus HHB14362 ss-1]|uniref:DUF6593 domain-containing protein n=1 Tax=Neolentinus lepideus HHB14362 ss-1 TaxID=1314782 RepID=A0A165SU79_9AGAM|nr:hypothetical protein NEOLEDRAFT_332192 [Neolentinus lepideus HHB14362 ss-1]
MSTSQNPYAAGWHHAGMEQSVQSSPWDYTTSSPSVYGALPYSGASSSASGGSTGGTVTLTFTAFTPTILNSVLIDAQTNIHFRIESNNSAIFTLIKDSHGKIVAVIEWRSQPTVEIRHVASKQNIRNWLGLSSDGLSRIMRVGNACYAWAPSGRHICLYTTSPAAPQMLAKVSKTHTTVNLEVTAQAMQLDLLEPSIVATLLLQSGRNID